MRFIRAIISFSLASLALAAPSNQHQPEPADGNNGGGYICCYNGDSARAGRRCILSKGADSRCGPGTSCLSSRIEDKLGHTRHSLHR